MCGVGARRRGQNPLRYAQTLVRRRRVKTAYRRVLTLSPARELGYPVGKHHGNLYWGGHGYCIECVVCLEKRFVCGAPAPGKSAAALLRTQNVVLGDFTSFVQTARARTAHAPRCIN